MSNSVQSESSAGGTHREPCPGGNATHLANLQHRVVEALAVAFQRLRRGLTRLLIPFVKFEFLSMD